MRDMIEDTRLRQVAEKVEAGVPVSTDDALYMLETGSIVDLGTIANYMREKLHGSRVFYGVNMNLNYTNVCELRCPLCAFSCDAGAQNAYVMRIDQVSEKVAAAVAMGIDEVHIVGGLNPELKIDYFEEMLRAIKKADPNLHIVAFTAVEYDYFARLNNIPIEEVFTRLIDAGLGALPGGGAEIFEPTVRNKIAPKKIPGSRWLEVMEIAHSLGLKTNATMLFNHLETSHHIVDHLSQVRNTQDKTGGFKTFVPLPFHEENTEIHAKNRSLTGYDIIRIYSTSRIFLHNVPHLKALWMYLGEKMAQVLLNFGVDDIGATYHYEKVVHAAGARTADYGSEDHLVRLIKNAGMTPVRTTAAYTPIRREES